MSLEKAISSGKEHRKGYSERGKPGQTDPTCRPHGGGNGRPCKHCEMNRLFKNIRRVDACAMTQEGWND